MVTWGLPAVVALLLAGPQAQHVPSVVGLTTCQDESGLVVEALRLQLVDETRDDRLGRIPIDVQHQEVALVALRTHPLAPALSPPTPEQEPLAPWKAASYTAL